MISREDFVRLFAYSAALFCTAFVTLLLFLVFLYDAVVILEPNRLFLLYEIILCSFGLVFFCKEYVLLIKKIREKRKEVYDL